LLGGRSAAPPCVRFSVILLAVISGLRAHGSSALQALAQHADPRRPVEFRGRRLCPTMMLPSRDSRQLSSHPESRDRSECDQS
jgi:hypothetical protein